MEIQKRIKDIRERISEASVRSNRKPEDVVLLAVTKTFPVETIRLAYEAGLRDFGENRVQEALGKMNELPADIRWHLVGQLQTNKINKIIGKFALVHSVDSVHLAAALSSRLGNLFQDVLLEVNTSGEDSKSGVDPDQALLTAEKVNSLPGLKMRGLMTVGPLTDDKQKIRGAFKKLKVLFEEMRAKDWAGPDFSILSMGMSNDFEMAVEEGSTLVRIGTALFGERH